LKGRIVPESLAPGARVADVARKYRICAQQLTQWRRAARSGRLALVTDDCSQCVPSISAAGMIRFPAEKHMEKNGFVSKVHFHRRKGSPLTAAQAKANAARSKVRSAVETIFAYNVTRFIWLTTRPAAA
jgi:transposase-like protein